MTFFPGALGGTRQTSKIKWPKLRPLLAQNLKSWRHAFYLVFHGSNGIYHQYLGSALEIESSVQRDADGVYIDMRLHYDASC